MLLKKLTFIIALFIVPLSSFADFKETNLLCDATLNVVNVGIEEGRSDLVVLTEYKLLNRDKAWYISIPILGEFEVFQDQQKYAASKTKGNKLEYLVELNRYSLDLEVRKLVVDGNGEEAVMHYDGKCRMANDPKI